MRKEIPILIFFLCFGNIAKTQNLVPNGNFEIYSQCPFGSAQFNDVVSWINAQPNSSPDYFNACTSTNANVPHSVFGYQKDYDGGAGIAGIYTFNKGFPNNARDYIQTKLNDTLKSGKKYLVSMYANNSDDFDYAIATLGIYFTNQSMPWPTNVGFINEPSPQIKNTILLKDTINWILVQDTIQGNGEKYLTIGNFNYDSLSDTTKIVGNGTFFGAAYYFIDGVSVYDVTDGSCNNYWDAGFSKYILAGDSVRLGAINTDNSTYVWQNSTGGATYLSNNTDARPWSTPSVTTTYYVTKTCPNNNVFIDTVTVYVQSTAGIKQFSDNRIQVTIYPNPSNGIFSINYDLKQNAQIQITDVSGKLVGTYNIETTENNIKIKNDNLQAGVYLYRVISNGANLKTGKIVVVK